MSRAAAAESLEAVTTPLLAARSALAGGEQLAAIGAPLADELRGGLGAARIKLVERGAQQLPELVIERPRLPDVGASIDGAAAGARIA